MGKRVVVAFPRIQSVHEWAEILSVRDRLDPLARRIPAHITLVFPFESAMSDFELETHLRELIAQSRRFSVVFQGITAYENEYLFLNIRRGNDEVMQLHDVLYSGALATYRVRRHTFVPHVTVGRVRSEEVPAALEATAGVNSPIKANIEAIAVYAVQHDGVRPVLFELELP
jgi:2'-5' RNA ligase